ncbi:MAG: radical SAM family heme chaperone HemW [Desulfovibrio sp.]|nr:radical SAM family heme chaperone HemW [Desulfovibrio sp.]
MYVHVPFCRSKCGYCSFYSAPLPAGAAGEDLLRSYLTALLREMRRRAAQYGRVPVETIFFGGGTPSLLPGRAVAGILDEARRSFNVAADAEISLEANPESLLLSDFPGEARRAGVNRLSIGVQSLDDAELAALGRAHGSRAARAAVDVARAAGFASVNLDVLWGLPGRAGRAPSQMRLLALLKDIADLRPDHISAYELTPEQGTPLAGALERGELVRPGEKSLASMYLAGAEYLESRGFLQYEVSNFARLGFACRHNLGYWQGQDYLGLGPSATSTLRNRRFTNPADLTEWIAATAHNADPPCEQIDTTTRLEEMLMLRLRTTAGLSFAEWRRASGRSFPADFAAPVALLRREGLAGLRRGYFFLTRTGMLVSDAIIARFFADLRTIITPSRGPARSRT